jgi:hypothetical protein
MTVEESNQALDTLRRMAAELRAAAPDVPGVFWVEEYGLEGEQSP